MNPDEFKTFLSALDENELTEVEVAMDRVSRAQAETNLATSELQGLISLLEEAE